MCLEHKGFLRTMPRYESKTHSDDCCLSSLLNLLRLKDGYQKDDFGFPDGVSFSPDKLKMIEKTVGRKRNQIKKEKHGDKWVPYFHVWVEEYDCPEEGSFSVRETRFTKCSPSTQVRGLEALWNDGALPPPR